MEPESRFLVWIVLASFPSLHSQRFGIRRVCGGQSTELIMEWPSQVIVRDKFAFKLPSRHLIEAECVANPNQCRRLSIFFLWWCLRSAEYHRNKLFFKEKIWQRFVTQACQLIHCRVSQRQTDIRPFRTFRWSPRHWAFALPLAIRFPQVSASWLRLKWVIDRV